MRAVKPKPRKLTFPPRGTTPCRAVVRAVGEEREAVVAGVERVGDAGAGRPRDHRALSHRRPLVADLHLSRAREHHEDLLFGRVAMEWPVALPRPDLLAPQAGEPRLWRQLPLDERAPPCSTSRGSTSARRRIRLVRSPGAGSSVLRRGSFALPRVVAAGHLDPGGRDTDDAGARQVGARRAFAHSEREHVETVGPGDERVGLLLDESVRQSPARTS